MVAGGELFTLDDMFKAAEIPAQKARIAKWKRDKKVRLAGMEQKRKSMEILDKGKSIDSLTGAELTALLKWHGIVKASDGKIDERREKWRATIDERKAAPSFKDWTMEEEAALARLESEPLSIKETALSRLKEDHKQDLIATFRTMHGEEKAEFLKELSDAKEVKCKEVEKGEGGGSDLN